MNKSIDNLSTEIGSVQGMAEGKAENRGTAEEHKVVELAREIGDRYVENVMLPETEQLPYGVFEELVETLEERLAGYASESLLIELRKLPPDSFAARRLIDQQLQLLTNHYDSILQADPNSISARKRRGQLKFECQDWEGAASDLGKVVEQSPSDVAAACLEVRARLNLSQDAHAFAKLQRLLLFKPDEGLALRLMVGILQKFGYFDLAEPHILRLEQSDDPDDIASAAAFYARQRQFAKASALVNDVLAIHPSHADSLQVLGQCALESGEYEEAIRVYSRFLRVVEPFAMFSHVRLVQLEAMRFLADAQAAAGHEGLAIDGYLRLAAAGDASYLVRRGYAKLTVNLLGGQDRREEATHLLSIAKGDGNREAIRAYAEWLARRADPRAASIWSQHATLDAESAAKWIEPNMTAEFSQGLPTKVFISDLEAPPYLERLPWIYTVQRLAITELAGDSRAGFGVLFRQNFPVLRELRIQAQQFGNECARLLVQAPFFDQLSSLALIDCGLGAAAMESIVDRLPAGIRALELPYSNAQSTLAVPRSIGDRFLQSRSLDELEVLDLTDCSLVREDIEKILAAQLPRLEFLVLTANDLSEVDPNWLIELPIVQQLRGLFVGETGIEKRIATLILDRLPFLALERLGLQGTWQQSDLAALQRHPNFPHLRTVDFGQASHGT